MSQELILLPAISMVALTFFVGGLLLRSRFLAVGRGEVNPRYFLLNRGAKLPEYLVQLEQNYSNLFELPVLFYLLIITLYVTKSVTEVQLWLAWTFVVTRLFHSTIHITVNRLRWRMISFIAGVILLMISWFLYLYQMINVQ